MEGIEEIRNRMVRKSASLWGVPINEIEMSFDPIVTLLISACAFEIEKLSREIGESQTRITEKLIQLMTPEMVYGPKPAHSILYTLPVEQRNLVKPEHVFFHKKKIPWKNASVRYRNVYFSSIKDFVLVNAEVKYIASGDSFRGVGDKLYPEELMSDNVGDSLPSSTLYIGITSEFDELDLNNLSFFFDISKTLGKELFFHHLKNSRWSQAENDIPVVPGFYTAKVARKIVLDSMFEDVANKSSNIVQQITQYYNKNYCTVYTGKKKHPLEASEFNEITDIINVNGINVENGVRWIKLEFPTIVTNDMLSQVTCAINTFPVISRALNEFTYNLKKYINIIPIVTDDHFLDINAIANVDGDEYTEKSGRLTDTDKGVFMIRNDNVGKLDHRKAREYLLHLIELLKDESASFSLFNKDFLQTNLKQLNQLIALLEKNVLEVIEKPMETSYVMVRPYRKKEKLLVSYWTTSGELGNGIKSGSEVEIYRGAGVKQKSSFLLRTTFGGRDEMSLEERNNAYRRSLLSRNRIVTKEDVKALCYEIYGGKIAAVHVENGYHKDQSRNRGLVQCIDIVITPSTKKVEEHEWDLLNSNLLLFLEKNSTNVFPYKIKFV